MSKKQHLENMHRIRLENKQRNISFNRLINGLDVDIWTISLGFCLVEVVVYGLRGKWIPLESSVVHDENINDMDAIYFFYLFVSLCVLWLFWLHLIAYFQMIRDRVYQKVFLMANYVQIGESNIDKYYDEYVLLYTNSILSQDNTNGNSAMNRKNNTTYLMFPKRLSPKNTIKQTHSAGNELPKPFGLHQLSCWHRLLFVSGFKYKNATNRFIAFMDGILSWSMGWAMAGAIFLSNSYAYRLSYAVIATRACILIETFRNSFIHKLGLLFLHFIQWHLLHTQAIMQKEYHFMV